VRQILEEMKSENNNPHFKFPIQFELANTPRAIPVAQILIIDSDSLKLFSLLQLYPFLKDEVSGKIIVQCLRQFNEGFT